MKEIPQSKVPKSIKRRLHDLEDHLYFLIRDLKDMKTDESYYKRIATELRVLICKTKHNKPLLLDLLEEFDKAKDYFVNHEDIFTKEKIKTRFLTIRIYDPDFIKPKYYSNKDLIILIASQAGSAHEDKSLDPGIAANERLTIGGIKPNIFYLSKIAEIIQKIGMDFLYKLVQEDKFSFLRKIKFEDNRNRPNL